jgi:hypothetical protein
VNADLLRGTGAFSAPVFFLILPAGIETVPDKPGANILTASDKNMYN